VGSEKIDPRNIELIDCFITEKELIERLITPDTDNKIHFKMFSNLLADPIGREEYLKYDGFYILTLST